MTKGPRRGKQEVPLVFDACLGTETTNKTKEQQKKEIGRKGLRLEGRSKCSF